MKVELKINKEIFLENLKSQIRYAKKIIYNLKLIKIL